MANRLADQLKIASRLREYEVGDATKQRDELVALWRKHHPVAAAEKSDAFHELMQLPGWRKISPDMPDEQWFNGVYSVTLRRKDDKVFESSKGGMIQLGISSLDGSARHDWRDFQAIKNQLAGPECEAFELYPAESRLLDPSNYYSLWCFPGIRRIKVGNDERLVRDADEALAPQRALAQPTDQSLAQGGRLADAGGKP